MWLHLDCMQAVSSTSLSALEIFVTIALYKSTHVIPCHSHHIFTKKIYGINADSSHCALFSLLKRNLIAA